MGENKTRNRRAHGTITEIIDQRVDSIIFAVRRFYQDIKLILQ